MPQQALTGHVHVVEQAKQRIKSASLGLGGDATNYMPLTKRQLETLTLTLQTPKPRSIPGSPATYGFYLNEQTVDYTLQIWDRRIPVSIS